MWNQAVIPMNIVQHYNLYQEPVFRIRKPCRGCNRMTKLNLIEVPCDACDGQGVVEDYWEPWHEKYITCNWCHGSEVRSFYMQYCDQYCFDATEDYL